MGRVIGEKAIDAIGSNLDILEQLAFIYQSWAEIVLKTGEASEVLVKYERLRATVAGMVEAHPSAPRYRSLLADCSRRIGIVLQSSARRRRCDRLLPPIHRRTGEAGEADADRPLRHSLLSVADLRRRVGSSLGPDRRRGPGRGRAGGRRGSPSPSTLAM